MLTISLRLVLTKRIFYTKQKYQILYYQKIESFQKNIQYKKVVHQQTMQEKLTLVTFKICPFAQRAVITCKQKALKNIQMRQVSLVDKSAFFTQTYAKAACRNQKSNGQVPILIVNSKNQKGQPVQHILAQSDLISWYLAQKYDSGNELIPQDHLQRAKMRHFLTGLNVPGTLISAFYSFLNYPNKSQEQQNASKEKALKALKYVQANIAGPYTMGQSLFLSDILLFPFLMRWCVHKKFFGLQITPQEHPKIVEFIKLMENRPSVQQERVSDQQLIQSYGPYFGFK